METIELLKSILTGIRQISRGDVEPELKTWSFKQMEFLMKEIKKREWKALLCQTCKWWNQPKEFKDEVDQFPGGDGHKSCEHPKVSGGSYSDEARKSIDALNTYESVGTGPDFGCIHWEAYESKRP